MREGVRATALLVGALALCGVATGAAEAQESAVHITVRGVTGPVLRAKPRHFVAVNVVLEHLSRAEADADGVVRVYRTRGPQQETPAQSLFYERRVDLPPGARRVVTIYYYCQEGEPDDRLAVAFVPDEGPAPPPAYPQLKLDADLVRVLAISSQPVDGPAAAFRNALIPGVAHPWRTTIESADRKDLSSLPDHMVGYDSFDCVFVTDLDPDALPADRAQALLDWVAAGGDLIVGFSGRQGDLDGSPLARTLPVSTPPGGRATVERQVLAIRQLAPGRDLPSADLVPVDRVSPKPGAEVLAGDEDGPLVVRGRFGAGTVTYLAFPLDSPPLRRWNGKPVMGSALLRTPRSPLVERDRVAEAPPLDEALLNLSEALETLTPPSALLVAPLLLLYVALVSPLNYKVFAKRRRLILTQATAGALALCFGGLFYGIGRLYKGSESLTTHVALVELAHAQGKSRVDVMTGFYSTDQGLATGHAHPLAQVGPIAEQNTSREGRVVQSDGSTKLESLTLDTWALRRFRSVRAEDLGFLEAEVVLENGLLKGTLDNRSQLTITEPLLLSEEGCFDLGTALASGTRTRLEGNRLTPYGKVNPSSLGFVDALYVDAARNYPARYGNSMTMGLGGDPYGSSQQRILGTLRRRLARMRRSPESLPALLVGRVLRDPEGVQIDAITSSKLERIYVFAEVRVGVEGVVRLLDMPPRVVGHTEDYLPVSGSTGSSPMLQNVIGGSEGVVEWSWQVPASPDKPFQPAQIQFRWTLDPNPVAPKLASFDAYNFSIDRWVQIIDPGELQYRLEDNRFWPHPDSTFDAREFVDPNSGFVRVRLRSGGNELLLRQITLDVIGRR